MAHLSKCMFRVMGTWVVSLILVGCAVNPHYEKLIATNQAVSATQPKDCEAHSEQVLSAISDMPHFHAQPIYSCPDEQMTQAGICHISVLVTAPDQSQWVLDNGTVLRDKTIAVAAVAELDNFLWALGDKPHWVGPMALSGMGLYIAATTQR